VALPAVLTAQVKAPPAGNSNNQIRTCQSFNEGWRFKRQASPGAAVEAEFVGAEQPGYDDSSWSTIFLPHTWDATADNPFTVPHHFRGLGWYRKAFVPPASWRGRRVWLEFKGVFQVADAWINAHHLGRHVGGFTGFQFDLTDVLKWDTSNLITVRVNDVLSPEIAPANETNVPGYGGIYRSVSLLVTDPIHVEANGTSISTGQSGQSVVVRVRSRLRNSGQVPHSVRLSCLIRDAQGQAVNTTDSDIRLAPGEERSMEQTFQIPSPHLWSPDSPYLYVLTSTLLVGDRAVDRVDTPFGMRFMSYDPARGFTLNGYPINLHGVNRRQDYGFLGDAVPEAIGVRDIRLIKEMGANFLRTSHYPQDPAVLDACDRLGVLVWEEIPNIKLYQYPPTSDLSVASDTTRFPRALMANLKYQLQEMIERDRNRPSIIIWGLADDLSGYRYPEDFVELSNAAHALDPTRWTAGRAPHVTDVFDATTERDLVRAHQEHPERMYIWNEWGAYRSERMQEGSSNLSGRGGRGTAQPLALVTSALADSDATILLEAFWMRYAALPWLGTLKWCMFDTGEVNKGRTTPVPRPDGTVTFRWPFNDYLGVADMWRLPKAGFYFLQSQWTEKPMVHIVGHWTWPADSGQKRMVRVYSNCDTVELILNGRSLGVHEAAPPERIWKDYQTLVALFAGRGQGNEPPAGAKLQHGPFIWDEVPYEPGTLVAIGRKGSAAVHSELRTAHAPARIDVKAEKAELSAGGEDVSFIEADVVDESGTIVPNTRPWIRFTVNGRARLLGSAAEIDAISGVAAINVQSVRDPGDITITATSPGLQPGSVRLRAVAKKN